MSIRASQKIGRRFCHVQSLYKNHIFYKNHIKDRNRYSKIKDIITIKIGYKRMSKAKAF